MVFSQTAWERWYGGPYGDVSRSVQQTFDAGFIVAGYTYSPGSNDDIYLIRTDFLGDTLWTRKFGGPQWEMGHCVQQTRDSGYIVAGEASSFGDGPQVYLLRTDASGDTLWTRTYGGADSETGFSVRQTNDGGYIVVGNTDSYGDGIQIYLLRLDANGDTLWTRIYGGTGQDEGRCVQLTTDSGFIVLGQTNSFSRGMKIYCLKATADGDTLWTRIYANAEDQWGRYIDLTSDGGYIITGFSWIPVYYEQVYLIKINAAGDTLWTRSHGGDGNDVGYSVQQTTDGGYVITGEGYSSALRNVQAYLLKTDAHGDSVWVRYFGGADYDEARSARQTIDGGYIIAGYTATYGNNGDVYLIKTDRSGNVINETTVGDKRIAPGGMNIIPNPFSSFARAVSHERERFDAFDICGRWVGSYRGDRIAYDLPPGVFFVLYENVESTPARIVKVR